jgi:hypothetical protein
LNNIFFFCLLGAISNFSRVAPDRIIPGNYLDTLPEISFTVKADVIARSLEKDAAVDFELRKLPSDKVGWESEKNMLRRRIWKASGVSADHNLPLDYRETGVIKRPGYIIKKVYFQSRAGVYVTANLYVPDGKGPFPAVINMHGHWAGGKAGEMGQSCTHELALNGYVCLNIDAWGSGERTTVHGVHEYHGSNLGASLLNVGETLLGAQLADNMRGVDLLCSLPYVDAKRIGATGASGGGNQTMWLSAMDERIKASMPVVSVGTFQSYIMASNCVCEMLPAGLTFAEEAGVLSLNAPRALMIASATQDKNKSFFPSEMLRSFTRIKPIYELYEKPENVAYRLFDTPHGYWPAMRETLIGWFDLHLKGKGNGSPRQEVRFRLLPEEELMVFPRGKRDPRVASTVEYCRKKGAEEIRKLRDLRVIDKKEKTDQLKKIIMYTRDDLRTVHHTKQTNSFENTILETTDRQLIPLQVFKAQGKNQPVTLVLFTDQTDQATRKTVVDGYLQRHHTIVVADLWGLGASVSPQAQVMDGSLPPFHTLARASFWLGNSVQGRWADQIRMITEYIKRRFSPGFVTVDAERETSIAALIAANLFNNIDTCILRSCPLSYVVTDRDGMSFFNMSIHLPGIIPWGDVTLLTAMSGCRLVEFRNPVSLSGKPVDAGKQKLFNEDVTVEMKKIGKTGVIRFTNNENLR